MKITVITPSFNSAATIRDTLISVRDQDYPFVEHVVMDGGSDDETLPIASSFKNLTMIRSTKDKGIYDAMNIGVTQTSGQIIGFLNSDDFYASPNVLSTVAKIFQEKNVDAVYGDLQYVSKKNVNRVVRHWRAGMFNQESFLYGWMPPHPTFFVRREIFMRYGRFRLEMGTAADYELMLRYLHKHAVKTAYIPEVLVKMRTGGASNISLKARLRANKKDKEAWRVNDLERFWFTLYLKPLRKIGQYIFR